MENNQIKEKYFSTRQWGFGSNIVNYLKFSFYCDKNNYKLILQDQNNSIGSDFELFSVIKLPSFIHRSKEIAYIPIYSVNTFIKFNKRSDYKLSEKIYYSYCFITGKNKGIFIKNFNRDKKVQSFFRNNYASSVANSFLRYWSYNEIIKAVFAQYDIDFDCENYTPDISIQIRGGDKISESLRRGVTPALMEDYLNVCIAGIDKINHPIVNVYVMTDTYSFFKIIKKRLEAVYPTVIVRSFVKSEHEGYIQEKFNTLDKQTKINSYYFFLYELEILRRSHLCIGSYASNIFYLASLITYLKDSKFISVDVEFENSFL
jgi:hypothetical protein